MTFRLLFILLLTLGAQAMSLPAASAQSLIDPRQRREARESDGGGMSLDRAVRLAESRYGAKAVRATTVNNGERLIHQIRLIRDGKVWTVSVDAQTGDMY